MKRDEINFAGGAHRGERMEDQMYEAEGPPLLGKGTDF
jgi:hypothetical protein